MDQEQTIEVIKLLKTLKEKVMCPICLDTMQDICELPCGHKFCSECFSQHKTSQKHVTCPLCKVPVMRRSKIYKDEYLNHLGIFVSNVCDYLKTNCNKYNEVEKLLIGYSEINEFDKLIESNNEPSTSKPKRLGSRSSAVKKTLKNSEATQFDSLQVNKTGRRTYTRKKDELKHDYTIREFVDTKNKESVLKWLNDTQNRFDRLSQTQHTVNDNQNINITDLPSVSQLKPNKSVNHDKIEKEQSKRRTKSADFGTGNPQLSRRKRFSELCVVLDNYNIEETNTEEERVVEKAEEKVLLDLIEDEYLNKLETELQKPSSKSIPKVKGIKKSSNKTVTATVTPSSSTGWSRISEINKNIKTPKVPKKLCVVLNTSQCSTSHTQKENLSAAANVASNEENVPVKPLSKNTSRTDNQSGSANVETNEENLPEKPKLRKSTSRTDVIKTEVKKEPNVYKDDESKKDESINNKTNVEETRKSKVQEHSNVSETLPAVNSKVYDLNEVENYLVKNIEICSKTYLDINKSCEKSDKIDSPNLDKRKSEIKISTEKQNLSCNLSNANQQPNTSKNNSGNDLDYFEPTQKWNENVHREDQIPPAVLDDQIPVLEEIDEQDLKFYSVEDLLSILSDNLQKCVQFAKLDKLLLLERGLRNMELIVKETKVLNNHQKQVIPVTENIACQTTILDAVNKSVQTVNIKTLVNSKSIQTIEQKTSEEKEVQTDFLEKSDGTFVSCQTSPQNGSRSIDVSKVITQKTRQALESFIDAPEISLPPTLKPQKEEGFSKVKTQNEIFTCTLDNIEFDTQEIIKKNVKSKSPQISQKPEMSANSQPQSQLICTVQTGRLRRNHNNSVKREAESNDSDEDIRPRAKRNRFLNSNLSVEFATNTERVSLYEEEKQRETQDSEDFNYDECLNAILKKYENPTFDEPQNSSGKQEKSILEKCDDIIEQVTKNVEKLSRRHDSNIQILGKSQDDKKKSETDIISESESLEPIPKKSKILKLDEAKPKLPVKLSEESDVEFKDAREELEFDDSLDDAYFENIEVPVEVHPTPKKVKIISDIVLKTPKKFKDEDLFSEDEDIVDSTPPKNKFLHNSQIIKDVAQDSTEDLGFDAIPPPPGFEDLPLKEKETDRLTQVTVLDYKQSSATPEKLENIQGKNVEISNKLSSTKKKKFDHSTPFMEIETNTERHALTCVSPIPKEKTNNLMVSAKSFITKLTSTPRSPKAKRNIMTSTPNQKSIWNYVKSPVAPTVEVAVPTKPCIACTRLSNFQMAAVFQLTNKKLASYSGAYNKDVTHMIVAVKSDNCMKDYTLKFVNAVASGLWVLRFDWIRECLDQNRIVPEEPYEILDDVGGNGPKTARLTRKQNPLLKDLKFYCFDQFETTTKKDMEELIMRLDGKVVNHPEDLTVEDGRIGLIISEGSVTQDFNTFEEWLQSYKVPTVDLEWLSRSVGRYKLLSIRPYLWCSDDNIDDLGYPSYLTEKVPFSIAE